MFKKILALVLATMMVLGGMVTVSAAEEAAAAEEVVYDYTAAAEDLAALDILKGSIVDNEIDFALENGVTRLQMALFIARIMTGETNDQYWSKVNDNTTPYDDVVNYFGAVSFADENGIIKGKGWIPGIGDNCFDPNGPITYQDAITMAVRALGYKQLQYPNGFLTVGEELGLTADLEPLAKDAELTRGQMIQILKNMLYAEVNGAESFAAQNFGLEENVYVIVATNLQYMIGADRVEKTGYVALAALNADGTYNYDNYLHFTEAELGLAKGEAELKMGYSYTVKSYNGYANVYSVEENATYTVKNYGDDGIAIAAGAKYNNVTDNSIVKIDGKTYSLVNSFSNLNNKSTSVGKNDELIVHSFFKGSTDSAFQYFIYDDALNILDQAGNIALYNFLGTYYVKLAVGYRVATEEDIAAYAINIAGASTDIYGIVTKAADLTQIQFSEITLIDDNNDGKYDRGVYIPYSVGKYETSSEKSAWLVSSSKDSGDTKKTVSKINGAWLNAVTTNTSGVWASRAKVQTSDITFKGEGKPASGEYIVYYYNPYARVLTVVENLGKPVTGTVQGLTQGTYAYDSTNKTYYYNGATVTIDGTAYKIGYRPYATRSQAFLTGREDAFEAGVSTDLQYIDSAIANYGYSEQLYASLLANNYKQMAYLVLAGRVIYASDASNSCGWMVFDYGTYTVNERPYTSYTYTGDVIGVDADGNILVKAYVDKTGDAVVAKIGSINGFNYGLLVEDYAALQFQFTGIGVLGTNAIETMKKIVIADFFKTLTADLGGNRQYVYIVTGVTEDGVYEIYTDLDLYWGTNGLTYRQPGKLAAQADVTIQSGISTTKMRTDAGKDKILVLNKDSVILVVGKDGIFTATGIPANGTKINFSKATAYTVSNDFIFVASKDYNADALYTGTFDTNRNLNAYNYYMVVGQVANDKYEENTIATSEWNGSTMVYTYKNMYNLATGEYETLTVEGGLPSYTATSIYGFNAVKPIGAIYAEKNGEYTLLTTLADYSSTLALGQYKYATDVATWLAAIFSGSNSAYAGVYKSSGVVGAKSVTGYTVKIGATTIYEDFALYYDRINVTYGTTGEIASVLVDNNKATTTDYSGKPIYYTYDADKNFFQGTVLNVSGKTAAELEAEQNAANAAAAKAAAIATAMDALEAVVDGVDTTIKCSCGADHDLAAHLASYEAWYASMADAAAVTAQSPADVEWFTDLVEAAVEAKINADNAAQAAKVGVVKAENTAAGTVLTLQNVSSQTFTGLLVYSVAENGQATKVATITLGATNTYADTATRSDVVVEWVRTGENGVMTLKTVDAFGVVDTVLAAGSYKFITVHNDGSSIASTEALPLA